jgi:hypothetical protein
MVAAADAAARHVPKFLAPQRSKFLASRATLPSLLSKLDSLLSHRHNGLFQGMQMSKSIELIWLSLHIIVVTTLDSVTDRIEKREQSSANKKGRSQCYAYFDMLSFIYSYTVLLEEIRQDQMTLKKAGESLETGAQGPRNIVHMWIIQGLINDALDRLNKQESNIQQSDNSPLPPQRWRYLPPLSKLPKPQTWPEKGAVQGRVDAQDH